MGPIGPIINKDKNVKCADPKLCYTDSNGKKHLRHFTLANNTFKLLAQQSFNCDTCHVCRKRRARELAIRCVLHSSMYSQNCFLTLTYDEKLSSYHNNFEYSDIQKFKKRLRRHVERHFNGKKIDIFNVHEYGKNGKKHWHLVVFNHDFEDKIMFTVKNGNKLYTSKTLERLWPHGFNTIGDVTEASAMYQAQYTQKDFKHGNVNNEKKSHSKHSGIGRDYFLKHYEQILRLGFLPFNGRKIPIPRYFQKLAHKHYAHFYDRQYFFPSPVRKLQYKFLCCEANKEMADLFKRFLAEREARIADLSEEWGTTIKPYVYSTSKPDFVKSGENKLYDFKNRLQKELF